MLQEAGNKSNSARIGSALTDADGGAEIGLEGPGLAPWVGRGVAPVGSGLGGVIPTSWLFVGVEVGVN